MRDAVSMPDVGLAAGGGCHPTILWIDDQPDEAGLLRFLSLEGFRVTTATTGTAGLALIGAHRYDAIVVVCYCYQTSQGSGVWGREARMLGLRPPLQR